MDEQWQLYDEQGLPLAGKGAGKDDIYGRALLHGAAHVWIWRRTAEGVEILVQKRATNKRTWPGRYDISAAGHIDLGEDPLIAALRETKEEISHDISKADLQLVGVHRCRDMAPDGTWTENELRWIYLLELTDDVAFTLIDGEVAALEWQPVEAVREEASSDTGNFVPHGSVYFGMLFEALDRLRIQGEENHDD